MGSVSEGGSGYCGVLGKGREGGWINGGAENGCIDGGG